MGYYFPKENDAIIYYMYDELVPSASSSYETMPDVSLQSKAQVTALTVTMTRLTSCVPLTVVNYIPSQVILETRQDALGKKPWLLLFV